MSNPVLTVGRHINGNYIIRIPYENVKLHNTIPRDSYEFDNNEFHIQKIKNANKFYESNNIFLKEEDYVEIAGHIINVKSTIYFEANTDEIINGWNLLKEIIDIKKLFKLFFTLDIRDLNEHSNDVNRINRLIIEPRIIILIRLAYWYFQCKKINSFKEKAKDIHVKLRISDEILNLVKEFGLNSEKVKQTFRQINTTISEMMFICIINKNNPTLISFKKEHEFLIENKIAEVKTIAPEFENTKLIENLNIKNIKQLKDLLFHFIKRSNIKENHLKKAIEKQKADVVLLNLTYSYQTKLLKSISNLEDAGEDFSMENSLTYIKNMTSKTRIPLVILFTAIGFEYSTFVVTIRLPIKQYANSKKINF